MIGVFCIFPPSWSCNTHFAGRTNFNGLEEIIDGKAGDVASRPGGGTSFNTAFFLWTDCVNYGTCIKCCKGTVRYRKKDMSWATHDQKAISLFCLGMIGCDVWFPGIFTFVTKSSVISSKDFLTAKILTKELRFISWQSKPNEDNAEKKRISQELSCARLFVAFEFQWFQAPRDLCCTTPITSQDVTPPNRCACNLPSWLAPPPTATAAAKYLDVVAKSLDVLPRSNFCCQINLWNRPKVRTGEES